MDTPSYLQEEATTCLELARVEEHAELKVILMGMVLGWLAMAKGVASQAADLESLGIAAEPEETW